VVLGSWLLTIYVTWSPWHFAGQNFGLALMTLRRRGVVIDAPFKRMLYASFVLSFLLATIPLHMSGSNVVFAQGTSDGGNAFRVLRAGISPDFALWAAAALALAYLATLTATGLALVRRVPRVPLADCAPAALIIVTQALWFAVPAYGVASGRWSDLGLAFAAIWISGAHAIQYLWVTSYYAKQRGDAKGSASFLTRALLVGSLIALPQLLFVPGLLGSYVEKAGSVAVLAFSVINLHHFLLDGAIWKLRDGRVARVLLGDDGGDEDEEDGTAGRRISPLRVALLALGAVCLLHPFYLYWQLSIATTSEGIELERVERAAERLAFLGVKKAPVLANVGWHRERAGDRAGAVEAYRDALALAPGDVAVAVRTIGLLLHAGEKGRALEVGRALVVQTGHRDSGALRALALAASGAGRADIERGASELAEQLDAGGAPPARATSSSRGP
jgi:hypothetical protein